VLSAKGEFLLRSYHGWLPRTELEDCLGQAALELVIRARREGGAFESPQHAKNALEQKLRSRICDRQRAQAGRSAVRAALARACSIEEAGCVPDPASDIEASVASELELRDAVALIGTLTSDQRLALLHEVFLGTAADEFCARYGWTQEKRRKVLQRARRRLREARSA
jgi:DNA-directed RNA polymerase specialized sigma24 family protein